MLSCLKMSAAEQVVFMTCICMGSLKHFCKWIKVPNLMAAAGMNIRSSFTKNFKITAVPCFIMLVLTCWQLDFHTWKIICQSLAQITA